MTQFVTLEKMINGEQVTFQPKINDDDTYHIKVHDSNQNRLKISKFPMHLPLWVLVEAMTLLKTAALSLKDRKITIEPGSNDAKEWAVWLSVFPKKSDRVSTYRKSALEFLEKCGLDELELILQFARCRDEKVKKKALGKIPQVGELSLKQRAMLYDFYVDTRFENAPLTSVISHDVITADDFFWKNYCIQAIKRIPSDEYPPPKSPQDQIPALVSQIGFRAFRLLDHQKIDANQDLFRQIRVALVCRGGLMESWYEEYRYWTAVGDVDRAMQVKPQYQARSKIQNACRKLLQAFEATQWEYVKKSFQVYLPPKAAHFQGGAGSDLMEQLELFLNSETQKVLLLQGDSGAGKSTFARFLYHQLFLEHSDYIPIFVPLPRVGEDLEAYLTKTFSQCKEHLVQLKKTQRFLFIMDGFDELAKHVNIYSINDLYEWEHAKCLITCRTQYLSQWSDYKAKFQATDPMQCPIKGSLIELFFSPFDERQCHTYLSKVKKAPGWDLSRYQKAMEYVPKEMKSNPFMLRTLVEVLPSMEHEHKQGMLKRCQIYEKMITERLGADVTRMVVNPKLNKKYNTTELKTFSKSLALNLWKRNKITLDLSDPNITSFANQDAQDVLDLLARKGCLLKHTDTPSSNENQSDDNDKQSGTFEFIHMSVMEYLVAGYLFNTLSRSNIEKTDFTHCYLSEHQAVVDFIVEMLWSISDEEREQLTGYLFNLIERSKSTESDDNDDENSCDEQTIKASSNSASILARAGIGFSGRDLRNVRLDRANLNGGLFHHVNLQGACLKKATLLQVQLVHTNLKSAHLTEVEFGEKLTMRATDFVNCIAHHPTKDECAAGLWNGNIIILDTKQAQVLRTLKGHEEHVTSVCYSPSGDRILSGSPDNTVRQWSSLGGAATHIFKGHESFVTSVCYSPAGDRILSGSHDKTVRQWSSIGESATHIFKGHEKEVTSVCYSPSGERILSGSWDKTVRQWSSLGGSATHIFKGHEDWVTSVCYSPLGDRILSGSRDKTVRQWSSLGGAATHIFKGHENAVLSVCYSPSGDRILSGSFDNTVRQWSSLGGSATHIFKGHERRVTSVCYCPSGDRILSGSWDDTVRQWSSLGGAATHIFKGHEDYVRSVCYSPLGDRILSGSDDKTIRQWSSLGGSATHIFKGHEDEVTSVSYSPSGDRILSGSVDKTVRQWSSLGGAATHIFRGHEREVTSVCYSPSGDRILSGSWDKTVRQWSSLGGAATHIFKGHERRVTSVCYSPSGDRILSGSYDNTVRQWSSLGGAATYIFKGHEKWVTSVCYSPSGDRILSGSYDNTVRQWSSLGGAATHIFKGHEKWVTSVCYSPSGDRILSGSEDKTARIWEVMQTADKSKPQIFTESLSILRGHHSVVNCVAWSKQNQIVTGSDDHTIAVWKMLERGDDGEMWAMVWRSGYTPIVAFGCLVDDHTNLSPSNRALIEQRNTEEKHYEIF